MVLNNQLAFLGGVTGAILIVVFLILGFDGGGEQPPDVVIPNNTNSTEQFWTVDNLTIDIEFNETLTLKTDNNSHT